MEACKYKIMAASGAVSKGLSKYFGYTVNTAVATAAILVRDGLTNAGPIIDTIPTSTAAGITKSLSIPVTASNGIFFDLNGGTGTIAILYEGQAET